MSGTGIRMGGTGREGRDWVRWEGEGRGGTEAMDYVLCYQP